MSDITITRPILTVRPSRNEQGKWVICNPESGNAVTFPGEISKDEERRAGHFARNARSYFLSSEAAYAAIPEWRAIAHAQIRKRHDVKQRKILAAPTLAGWKRGSFHPALRRDAADVSSEAFDRLPMPGHIHPHAPGLIVHRAAGVDPEDGSLYPVKGAGWKVSHISSGLSVSGPTKIPDSTSAKIVALRLAELCDFTQNADAIRRSLSTEDRRALELRREAA